MYILMSVCWVHNPCDSHYMLIIILFLTYCIGNKTSSLQLKFSEAWKLLKQRIRLLPVRKQEWLLAFWSSFYSFSPSLWYHWAQCMQLNILSIRAWYGGSHDLVCYYCYYDNSLNYCIMRIPTLEDCVSTSMLSIGGTYVTVCSVVCHCV